MELNNIMDKIRIIMLGHKVVPSREGGVEIVVGELATELVKRGNDVLLFNRKRKGIKQESYNGIKIEDVFTINRKGLDALIYAWFATRKVKKIAKKGKIDVIHFHAEGPTAFLNRFPRRKKRNYKIVVTIHGLDWQRSKWGKFGSRFLLYCEKKIVKYADEIIVLSKNVQHYFLERYNRQTTYIPNSTTKPVFREPNLISEKWGLQKGEYILFLGRIVPEKGLHYLIDAWKDVVRETKTTKKLVIAGKSSHTDEYYNSVFASANGDESIIFTGFVKDQALEELFSNAYLYVLPSDIEGMSISLLEALSYGNVCLVSDIEENKEVINEQCFVFKHGNVSDLKDKIIQCLNANFNFHETLCPMMSWEEVVDETIKVYKK